MAGIRLPRQAPPPPALAMRPGAERELAFMLAFDAHRVEVRKSQRLDDGPQRRATTRLGGGELSSPHIRRIKGCATSSPGDNPLAP